MKHIHRLIQGNRQFMENSDAARREDLAVNGQQPHCVVLACSDSRVIPEAIFGAELGELFVVRVAGNVVGDHALGSIQYAIEHLGCNRVIVLGHTGCGAVASALEGHAEGYILTIVNDILQAVGTERDPGRACRLNVAHVAERVKGVVPSADVRGAIYDMMTGGVEWL